MSWDCSKYCHSSIWKEKVPGNPNTDQSIRPGTGLITMPSITEYEIVGYTENNDPVIDSTEKRLCHFKIAVPGLFLSKAAPRT